MKLNVFKSKREQNHQVNCRHSVDSPNGWGHQEFDGTFYKFSWDKQRDVNNKLDRFSFIRDFQIRYIDGIHLKKPLEQKRCMKCNC